MMTTHTLLNDDDAHATHTSMYIAYVRCPPPVQDTLYATCNSSINSSTTSGEEFVCGKFRYLFVPHFSGTEY